MYNYNFVSSGNGFISDNPNVRNVSNDCELKESNTPEPTYYTNSSLSSRKILTRRPTGIGKINQK